MTTLVLFTLAGSPAGAQSPDPAAPGAFDGLLETLQLKGHAAPAAPFVTQTRPKGTQSFLPIGTPHPARSEKVLTGAEIAATENELDAARVNQQRRAGQKPAVVPLQPTAVTPPLKKAVR